MEADFIPGHDPYFVKTSVMPQQFTLPENAVTFSVDNGATEVVKIGPEGRVYWRGREVESDDDFRAAMLDLSAVMRGAANWSRA